MSANALDSNGARPLPAWRAACSSIADFLAIISVLSLPWSTSLLSIFLAIWLLAVTPTIELHTFVKSLKRAICAVPIALFLLAVVGTLWSPAPWGTRLYYIGPTAKLMVLPLLIYHFERSQAGLRVLIAFLVSCSVLLVMSWTSYFFSPTLVDIAHSLGINTKDYAVGLPVKNYITQGQEFVVCAFGCAIAAVALWRGNRTLSAGFAILGAAFVVNLLFVISSRTALVCIPILAVVFSFRYLTYRVSVILLVGMTFILGAAWVSSPYLRARVDAAVTGYSAYMRKNDVNSSGERLEFWRKSLTFLRSAPLIGHGTGSVRSLFEQDAVGKTKVSAEVISNPHNQAFYFGIQWGFVGIILLFTMWTLHFRLFNGVGWGPWLGTLVVVQNVVGSIFNSHLSDFVEGWIYVIGVGIAAGISRNFRVRRGFRAARDATGIDPIFETGCRPGINEMKTIDFEMNRFKDLTWRNLLIALHDALATAAAVVLSFYLRFHGQEFRGRVHLLLLILPGFVVFSVAVCYCFRLTTTKWRFISLPDALNIVLTATVLTGALLVIDYIFLAPNLYGSFFLGKTTMLIYWFLEIAFLSSSRMAYRYYRNARTVSKAKLLGRSPTLLVGRAADAEVFLRSIESGAVKQLWPVGLLSPSRADRGQSIRGIPVLGGIEDIDDVVNDYAKRNKPIERIVMTPSAFEPGAQPDAILVRGRKLGLKVSRLPSLDESREMPRLAPVAVEDLLLRPSRAIDYERLEALVKNKSVVVTGGGGSIGSEICDRVVTFGASRLLIIENSEPALYAVVEALGVKNRPAVVEGRIADIRDRERLLRLMDEFKPDIVFHAAALKHVPILERDWSEGVKTNIFGSVNVADAALASGAEAMVMISTDKAIEPVSMLGLTKRFAEMYCQALDHKLGQSADGKVPMRLISVRFGNVLASNGSVVPKFKAQIEAGGPVTVTHPDMVRYFMTIREACDLVITAASHAMTPDRPDVSVYVLNMGQPVKIVDLAERMIRLSGLQPHHDIEISFTGVRPGERLNEILFASEEPTIEIGLSGILAAKPNEPPMDLLHKWLATLTEAVAIEDKSTIRSVLKDAVPEFKASA